MGLGGSHFSQTDFGLRAIEPAIGDQIVQPDSLGCHDVKSENPGQIPRQHLGPGAADHQVEVIQAQASQD